MERITTEEVIDKLDMFQSRFGKIDKSFRWDLEKISEYVGTQFNSTEFQDEFQTRRIHLRLAAPEHQEMNGKVEVTRRTLHTIDHSIMLHTIVLEAYIHFTSMYTEYHIVPVLPIKDLIN